MAGEMTKQDVTIENYPIHFKIAGALGGTVEPFDMYQGPYISIGKDVRIGSGVYAAAPRIPGVVRLWVLDNEHGFYCIYNEGNEKTSSYYWNIADAIIAAKEVT